MIISSRHPEEQCDQESRRSCFHRQHRDSSFAQNPELGLSSLGRGILRLLQFS